EQLLLALVGDARPVEAGAQVLHHGQQAKDAAVLGHGADAELGGLVRGHAGDGPRSERGRAAAGAEEAPDAAHRGAPRDAVATRLRPSRPTTSPRPTWSDTPCRM